MRSLKKIDELLSVVGLLRARISVVRKWACDRQAGYRNDFQPVPGALTCLMAETQNNFVELLKASDILFTASENIRTSRDEEEFFSSCIEDWALAQTGEKLKTVRIYFESLSRFEFDNEHFEPRVYEDGLFLIEDALNAQELT